MLQGALAGLAAGGLYAVLAVCLTLMSRLVRVINFAQSATGMFGCYVAVFLSVHWGLPEWLATVTGIVLGGALSAVLGWIISTWLAEADTGTRSAATVAVLLLLISLAFIVFGNKPQPFHPLLAGPAFILGGVVISQVTVVTVTLAVLVALSCRVVLANAGAGVYVPAEFYPFTDADSPQNKDWRDLMTRNRIPLTSFSQGGYLAAKYFLQVVKGIQGDITRESVTKALREMKPISDPMVGTPYVFGPAATHHDNVAGWPIKLLSGTNKWELAARDWLRIPKS